MHLTRLRHRSSRANSGSACLEQLTGVTARCATLGCIASARYTRHDPHAPHIRATLARPTRGCAIGAAFGARRLDPYGQAVARQPRRAALSTHSLSTWPLPPGCTRRRLWRRGEPRSTSWNRSGCGCAFVDYDNDGWMDIFLLRGTRLDGAPPGATNRLYKNNRDGTFTDVTEQAGLRAVGWASGVCVGDYNNDGFEDLFCTNFGQNILYRNNGDGTFTDVTKAAGLLERPAAMGRGMHLPGLQPRRTPRSVRLQLHPILVRARARSRGEQQLSLERDSRRMRTARAADGTTFPVPKQRRWNVHRRQPAGRHRSGDTKLRHDRGGGGSGRRRVAGHLRCLRFDPQPAVHEQP